MINTRVRKLGLGLSMIWIVGVLASCGGRESPLTKMEYPIRLVRNDTITQVEDKNGRMYTLNSMEKFEYDTALLSLGDTLEITSEI